MSTDARGHTVPASSEAPARKAFLDLALSVRDPIPVTSVSDRTAKLAALAALIPAITPSTSTPIFFYQADLPRGLRTLVTTDGVNFIAMSGEYVWADATARAAATGMSAGDFGRQVDTLVQYRYDGSAWKEWQSSWLTYTATLTGTTVGTGGTHTGRYRWEQGRVRVQTFTVLGSSGFTFGGYVVALPVTAATPHSSFCGYVSSASFDDVSSGNSYEGFVAATAASTTQASVLLMGTNGLRVGPSASTPFTWAAGDKIKTEFVYDPA